MLSTELKILRVFGLPASEVTALLRTARDEGCPGLRLLERDGEFAVCVQVSAPTKEMAEAHCDKWVQKLRAKFGDAVYAVGETSLAQATLDALLQKRRLIVAADETTGRLMGALLQPLPHSEAVFDFGNETWADARRLREITAQPSWLQKFPGDEVQAAAARALNALNVGRADYAAVYMPAAVDRAPFVLLCDKRSAWAAALDTDSKDAAIGNQILDLVRRRTLGLKPGGSTIAFRPGRDPAELLQPGEKGNTTRFSLRRARPKTANEAFEPMLDYDTAAPGAPGTGTITFERPAQPPASEASDPLNIRTAGAEAAAESRRRRVIRRAQPAPEQTPPPSLLDEEIPDLSATMDPAALAEAFAKDEADARAGRTHSAGEFRRAADKLFTDAEEEPAAVKRNRSLEAIEKAERRQRRSVIAVLAVLLLLLTAAGAGIWLFFRSDLGAKPSTKNYGTAAFDASAQNYLSNALEKRPGVQGYLAFSDMDGMFVYPNGTVSDDPEADPIAVLDGRSWLNAEMPSHTVLSCGGSALAAYDTLEHLQKNSGFTVYFPDHAYRFKVLAVFYDDGVLDLTRHDLSAYYDYLGFVTDVKVRSLYDTGVAVESDDTFLTLVADSGQDGVRLCITGRLIEENEPAQLSASAIQTVEEPLLTATQYERSGRSAPSLAELLAGQLDWYTAQSAVTPEATQKPETTVPDSSGLAEELAELQERTDELLASADELLAGLTDIAGSSDATESDLGQGAEGSLPEQSITVDQLTGGSATTAPTTAPTQPPAESGGGDTTESPTQEPTAQPTQAPSAAETINVTMNGVAQTMDLVQCLAMVAQNELGPSAPAEAYKAQCVATHCWILSQGGYPSVLGQTPGAAALAAAQEVARVLVTYNGQVCFTPYFASASTGTASSKDVWGGERAWLQAVDSPYDQQYATNWHTNGSTSGTARFSRETLQQRIYEKMGVDLSGLDPNQWFTILSTNQYGWVTQMQIGLNESGNDTCSGRWFRETLLARQSVDGRSLRSQCFTVSYDASLDCFIFDVYGYGHGCGLSQWGAIGCAQNGWTYQQILTHYYPGTTLTTY